MTFAGVAQLQERQPSRLQVAGENPAPRSPSLAPSAARTAMSVGLITAFGQHDPVALLAGRRDGLSGALFQPRQFDWLSYASGYREGELFRPHTTTEACHADDLSRLRLHG
jgi:hypothetical protein